MPSESPETENRMMTLPEAEAELAALEKVYKEKGAALRAYIKVLKVSEDPQDRQNRIADESEVEDD